MGYSAASSSSIAGSMTSGLTMASDAPGRSHDQLAMRWCACLTSVRCCWQSGLRASDLAALERRQQADLGGGCFALQIELPREAVQHAILRDEADGHVLEVWQAVPLDGRGGKKRRRALGTIWRVVRESGGDGPTDAHAQGGMQGRRGPTGRLAEAGCMKLRAAWSTIWR